ncbi:MAG TPA: type I methionyl aminopeptidase [Candidatus Paceibacterota bacterium]|nr:type I methionyl aminopeptidase [Candidatus Paceibacterota bacterium]
MKIIKTEKEIEIMAEAGRRLAHVVAFLEKSVKAGITTNELDAIAYKMIKDAGCKPAFLNYRPRGAKKGYPATACISVNEDVVHGIPSDYVINDGDIVKIDLGLIHKGFYSDAAVTVGIGAIGIKNRKLIETTKKAMELGIKEARPGNTVGDIGYAIEHHVKSNGFSIVDLLTGHGIGRSLHEEPHIYNFGERGKGERLVAGMVIAIEPMVAAGKGKVIQNKDDSFTMADGSMSAHFENTIAIMEDGPVVLTKI